MKWSGGLGTGTTECRIAGHVHAISTGCSDARDGDLGNWLWLGLCGSDVRIG